jgi:hypothetical protein
MVEALIVAGCYLAFWSNANSVGPVARPMIFVFLFLACVLAVATGRVRRIGTTPLEMLLYTIAVLSAVVSLLRGEDYCIYYTMYYVVIIVFASVLARAVSLPRLMDLGAYVTLLCLVTCLAVDSKGLFAALQLSVNANGLLRYSALNNHPLLIGYIFGSGSILLARRVYLARKQLERAVMALGVLLCWTILLAASSRSAIIAMGVSAVFALLLELHVLRGLTFMRFLAGVTLITGVAIVCLGPASDYLTHILELDSSYRGFGTGATGRTVLWMKSLESLTSDPTLIAFGGGLRSSEYSVIGFLTENSYLTILLDSGIFFGTALIVYMIYAPFRALALRRSLAPVSPDADRAIALYAAYFVFLLIQCFFLRYFIGIGNPTSLLTLLFMMSLSLYPGFQAARAEERPAIAERAELPSRLARAKT